jgi:hypothetical protein
VDDGEDAAPGEDGELDGHGATVLQAGLARKTMPSQG